jgi:agmatine deiminase
MTLLVLTQLACTPTPTTSLLDGTERRTPAEWEPQEAVWLQWPQAWEGDDFETAFVNIVEVLAQYETVQLIAADAATERAGAQALAHVDGDIQWTQVPASSIWMRDNGPRYVELDGEQVLQNWEFDGYHDGRPRWMWADDNTNPDALAEQMGLPQEHVALVHERGDLEVNGSDTAIVNWSVVGHRNPGMTRDQATAVFQQTLGVERVIYLEGFHPQDVTRGHVDGIARFIDEDTVVVADDGSALNDTAARQIADQAPDLEILRLELMDGDPTLNWLVGDGYVLTGTTGDDAADTEIAEEINVWFPERTVHFVDIDTLWQNGGGVHCVTNDQPERP